MDDPLMVRVLDRMADLHEEVQASLSREPRLVAVFGDGNPADELHHEVRAPCLCGACVEHFCDVGVVHQRQRLPLGFEPSDNLPGVHAQLDDLKGHSPLDWFALLGGPHRAEAALTELFQELEAVDYG